MFDKIINSIKADFPEVRAIYLFGSQADGTATKDSDFDIAVLCEGRIGFAKLLDASSALSNIVSKEVDLVDLREASTVFCFQVIMNGRKIFGKNNPSVDFFEMTTMSMYQRLNEERKGILEQVHRTGKIYSFE